MSRLQFLFFYLLPGVFFWAVSQWLLGDDLIGRAGQLLFFAMVLLQYRLTAQDQRGSVLLHGAGIYLYAIYLLPPGISGFVLWTLLGLFLFLPGSLFIGYPYRHPLILIVLIGGVAGIAVGLTDPHPFWLFSEAAPFESMPYLALIPAAYMVWRESGHLLEIVGMIAGLGATLSLSGEGHRLLSILTGPYFSLLILYFSMPFRSRYPGYLRPVLAGLLFFFLFLPFHVFSFWFHSGQTAILWLSAAFFVLQDWLLAPLHRFFRRAMF